MYYPQPKMNQKSPKDPKSILILTTKLLYTYFWKMLPVGVLIWLAPIWLTWAQIAQPTSNHQKPCENFWKSKIKYYHSNTHTIYYILSIYFFHQIFVLSEIWTNLSKHVPNFPPLQIWTFWPKESKNSNFTFSSLAHCPQSKLKQQSLKDPKLILILTMKLVYTYFW